MQMLDMYVIILPALHGAGVHLAFWIFCAHQHRRHAWPFFICAIGKTSVFPVRDPRLLESFD